MPRVEAHQIDTYYQRIGQGPTLLLLHGWRNDWQSWSPLIADLAQHYNLIVPDLPGFGRSATPPDGWDTKQFTTWLREFLKELEVNELEAVLGHSYGAKVAGWFWLTRTQPVVTVNKGLFLLDPSGVPNRLAWYQRGLQIVLPWLPQSWKRGALAKLRPWLYRSLDADSDYLLATPWQEATLQQILREDIRTLIRTPRNVPLHLCFGACDPATPLWMAYAWLPLSTQSEVFVVPDTGHHPHHEQTKLVLTWLETYLKA